MKVVLTLEFAFLRNPPDNYFERHLMGRGESFLITFHLEYSMRACLAIPTPTSPYGMAVCSNIMRDIKRERQRLEWPSRETRVFLP